MAKREEVEAWLTDMDGVLVHENHALPGASALLQQWEDAGTPYLVLTNNSIFTARDLSARLRASGLKFVGNIEPHAVFRGEADVAVCDGFVGNVILKTAEGLAESLFTIIGGAVQDAARVDPAVGESLKRVLGGVKAKLDYATYGGAPLLGFEGVVLIGHGRSSAEAVASAVRTGHEFVVKRVNERIRETIVATRARRGEDAA